MTISKSRELRERAEAEYGSYETFQHKEALIERDSELVRDFEARWRGQKPAPKIEAIADELKALPFWMSQFELTKVPLGALGAPEGSSEWARIEDGRELRGRLRQTLGVAYANYTELGWPKSAGKAVRLVTAQEDAEILRQLKVGGLTKPGSDVALVGQTLAEMLEDDEKTPEWLIEGLLRRGGSAMVYGPSGVGKTWLTHTIMLLAVAGRGVGVANENTGGFVLQAGKHEGVKVCLLDGEMTKADLTQRAKDLCGVLGLKMMGSVKEMPPIDLEQLEVALGEDGAEFVAGLGSHSGEPTHNPTNESIDEAQEDGPQIDLNKMVVYSKARQHHKAEFPDLVEPEWMPRVIEYCQREHVDLLVLDNLSTLTATLEDENSAANWNPLNTLVVALKRAGVAVLLVHHSNKNGSGYRGSTALSTTLETVVRLEKLDGPDAKGGAGFKVKVEKDRANGRPEVDGKTLLLREGKWRVHFDELGEAENLVAMVKTLRYTTQKELGEALGVEQSTISRMFKNAEALGLSKDGELSGLLRKARELKASYNEPAPEDEAEELVI